MIYKQKRLESGNSPKVAHREKSPTGYCTLCFVVITTSKKTKQNIIKVDKFNLQLHIVHPGLI